MRNFPAALARASSVATITAVATLVVAALSGAFAISSLIGRVEKLESDLGKAQAELAASQTKLSATIDALAASQTKLSATIDAADRSIKSLRSDLDQPRVRPLASILGGGAGLQR